MADPCFRDALILTGPTASGKSALALELAEHVGAEIIALDSMTLYRGLDIGTAKPSAAEQARVPHHLLDVLEPWESASVADWLKRAEAAAQNIVSRGKKPLLVGGTPMYLKALLFGLFAGPPADAELRERLLREEPAALHARLQTADPEAAARLHVNDVRRVVRALEVWELTGRPLSSFQTEWQTLPATAPPVVWLDWPRAELYRRINERVTAMLAAGWLDECRALPRPLSKQAAEAIGYRELLDYLACGGDLDAVADAIRTRSRQFAKRQLTWFRHLPGLVALPGFAPVADNLCAASAIWAGAKNAPKVERPPDPVL